VIVLGILLTSFRLASSRSSSDGTGRTGSRDRPGTLYPLSRDI
jgi:hypothetical protein